MRELKKVAVRDLMPGMIVPFAVGNHVISSVDVNADTGECLVTYANGKSSSLHQDVTLRVFDPSDPTVSPTDNVNHPTHYTSHPSGIECIQVTEHMNFNIGNAVKYLWRTDEKGDPIENLKKAAWYVNREIERRGKGATPNETR